MGCTARTEPQSLYKGALYLFLWINSERCMGLSIIHNRLNPTEKSERFYPSLFENVNERQRWVENSMYYSESSLRFPASSFIRMFHGIVRSSEKK